ncbi:MAG: hypothetical protein JXA67_16090, partial [Micromonosporaceae bacterium]|nr:hypothetical protein [Micromonosporaceae bacterium]
VVIAAVEGISRTLILPFGLAVYVAKFAVIIAVLAALDGGTWPGKAALGYGMIVAAIVWCSALVGWLVRTRYPYADYP